MLGLALLRILLLLDDAIAQGEHLFENITCKQQRCLFGDERVDAADQFFNAFMLWGLCPLCETRVGKAEDAAVALVVARGFLFDVMQRLPQGLLQTLQLRRRFGDHLSGLGDLGSKWILRHDRGKIIVHLFVLAHNAPLLWLKSIRQLDDRPDGELPTTRGAWDIRLPSFPSLATLLDSTGQVIVDLPHGLFSGGLLDQRCSQLQVIPCDGLASSLHGVLHGALLWLSPLPDEYTTKLLQHCQPQRILASHHRQIRCQALHHHPRILPHFGIVVVHGKIFHNQFAGCRACSHDCSLYDRLKDLCHSPRDPKRHPFLDIRLALQHWQTVIDGHQRWQALLGQAKLLGHPRFGGTRGTSAPSPNPWRARHACGLGGHGGVGWHCGHRGSRGRKLGRGHLRGGGFGKAHRHRH
mmetsp:Transcript_40269/g.67120  ORF Transcript_40269/g.67120 Transcript_40269/m.67120 type:complete len:410 (+) Transcript_40269:3154-4383(+)